jgi:hypothetical protein
MTPADAAVLDELILARVNQRAAESHE